MNTPAAPTPAQKVRYIAPDLARGLALLGIALANLPTAWAAPETADSAGYFGGIHGDAGMAEQIERELLDIKSVLNQCQNTYKKHQEKKVGMPFLLLFSLNASVQRLLCQTFLIAMCFETLSIILNFVYTLLTALDIMIVWMIY